MSQKSNGVAFRASLLYGLVAATWISLSDWFLSEITHDKNRLIELETYKGWVFVVFTALLLFVIMRQLLRRESKKIVELKKSEALTRLQNEALQMIATGKPLADTLEVLLLGIEGQAPRFRPGNLGSRESPSRRVMQHHKPGQTRIISREEAQNPQKGTRDFHAEAQRRGDR